MTTSVRIGKIKSVDFALYSPQQIKKLSVVHVTETSPYMRNFPRANGVNDLRMGTTDRRFHCSTCKNDIIKCSGHMGHIELAEPVYHTGFFPVILKLLRCVCFMCSRIKVQEEELGEYSEMYGLERLNALSKCLTTKLTCVHCQGPQPLYKRVGLNIAVTFKPKQIEAFESPEEAAFCTKPFTPKTVRSILKHISDEDATMLGLNPELTRPEWMVLTVLIVPPPIIRPSIMASDGSKIRGQDDLTTKLQEIIKVNNALRVEHMSTKPDSQKAEKDRQALWDQLQAHVAMFVYRDVKVKGLTSNKGSKVNRKLRMIFDRFKGKRGRIRGNLQGKRVNYSARSVVSPDPIMDIDLVGVPQDLAMRLSVPVKVAPFNLEQLTQYVRNGSDHPNGAACIVLEDQTIIDLKLMKDTSNIKLELGWTVERFLQNGDWVMFNRQPSLHKMSIMAHKVKIIPGKSFRLSLCNTTPYNADFDGDEMNIHALRTLPATAELEGIMAVKHQIVSPQSNKPIIGLVIDSVLSGYLMTRRDSFFTREEACQLIMGIQYPQRPTWSCPLPAPAILKPTALWTGKQLFSLIFPKLRVSRQVNDPVDFAYNKVLDDGEGYLHVLGGELLCGALCKKSLGTSSGGLIHVIYNDFGPDAAVQFISDAQRILVKYMERRGFSVGIGDCLIGTEPEANISNLLHQTKEQGLWNSLQDNDGHGDHAEAVNTKMFQGMLTNTFSLVQPTLAKDNSLLHMSRSGAKGSAINIAQICGCVGQQSIGGRRVQPGRNGRTLSSFLPMDMASQARGFVENSYITGLNAEEYFFHAMGGREGLVDTAVKTASTGYIQRRMMKAMESLKVAYDNTVRDARNKIIQFSYGGNSFDAARVERIGMKLLFKSNADVLDSYLCTVQQLQDVYQTPFTLPEMTLLEQELRLELQGLLMGRDIVRAGRCNLTTGQEVADTVYLPINMQRLFERSQDVCSAFKGTTDLHPLYVAAKRNQLYREIISLYGLNESAVLRAYIQSTFSFKDIYVANQLLKDGFDWMCKTILNTCVRAHVVPGEMVGAVGASSIGEPTTQMTLNTFHYSGVASKDVTLGMPRLKELIDAVPSIRTPSMTIRFPEYAARNREWVSTFAMNLECLRLSQVVDEMSIVPELLPPFDYLASDDAFAVHCFHALNPSPSGVVPDSVLRYVLNKKKLQHHGLLPVHVAQAVQQYFVDKVTIIYADALMEEWFLRLKFKGLNRPSEELYAVAIKEVHEHLMETLVVHGHESVARVILHEEKQHVLDGASGSLQHRDQWCVDTQGSCFQDVLNMKGVDYIQCISNDVNEVTEVLGIEAGAQLLKMEITSVLSFDGTYVNEHHIKLLVDTMTHEGTLQPMTRHGITKVNGGVFQRASFEETMEVFLEAATFASTDTVSGVTENIMLGKLAPVGTAAFDLVCPSVQPVTSDVQQFVPKRAKCPPLFLEKDVPKVVVSTIMPSTISGPLTVQPLDLENELSDDEVADMEGVLSEMGHAARQTSVPLTTPRAFPYAPSSPVYQPGSYVPSSPVYL
jgi:DNA-directed RNA polymerase II subunit RPB1